MQKHFDLKVGFTCNNDCIHCVITDKKATKDYTTKDIKDIIDSVDTHHTIGFTGGEPTIRHDFVELVRYAKNTGHLTNVQTNGTMFESLEFTRSLEGYLDSALIAIHSSVESIHDEIVGANGKGMHKRTIKGFLNLTNSKIEVSTQTVISRINMSSLRKTYDWIQSVAPGTGMSMTYPHPNGNAWRNRDIVVPSYTELKPHIHKALEKWASLLRTEAIPLCYLVPYQNDLLYNFDMATMDPNCGGSGIDPANAVPEDEQVNKDMFDSTGRIENYQIANISERRKGPKCAECIYDSKCPGVWKEYAIIHAKHFDLFPITEGEINLTKQEKPKKRDVILGKTGALIMSSNIKCPNTCLFCSGGKSPDSDEEIKRKAFENADYFIKNGYDSIEISGGDPGDMLYILPKLIKYLHDGGIRSIMLSTHGRSLSDMNFVLQLKDAGLSAVRIPLYGSTPEIHNKMVQAYTNSKDPAPFREAILGIINSRSAGIGIRAHTVITQHNKDDIDNILLTYKAAVESVGRVVDEYVVSVGGISTATYDWTNTWFLPMKDAGPCLDKILKSPLMDEIDVKFIEIPYCVIGRDERRFWNGSEEDVTMSPDLGEQICEANMGSENDNSIPHYRVKKHFSECKDCSLLHKCSGMALNDLKMFGYYGLKAIK